MLTQRDQRERRARRAWATAALVGILAAACSDGAQDGGAAEPANAPSPDVPPAGRVVKLGAPAEGIVMDPKTHTVAVGLRKPDALALVDARSGKVRDRVELPGRLRHLQLQGPGGPVLAPVESADRLLRIDIETGSVTDSITTGKHPHDATAAGDDAVFVADEFGGTVSVVREGRVVHTFGGLTQPGGIAAADDRVGLIDVEDDTLTVYDAERLTKVAEVDAGSGPTHIVADRRGRMAVADTRGGALLLFDLTPDVRPAARTDLPGEPYGVAYDAHKDRLWVTLTGRNEVVGMDLGAGEPREAARLPTVVQPNTVAVDADSGQVYVTSRTAGTLQIIDSPD